MNIFYQKSSSHIYDISLIVFGWVWITWSSRFLFVGKLLSQIITLLMISPLFMFKVKLMASNNISFIIHVVSSVVSIRCLTKCKRMIWIDLNFHIGYLIWFFLTKLTKFFKSRKSKHIWKKSIFSIVFKTLTKIYINLSIKN